MLNRRQFIAGAATVLLTSTGCAKLMPRSPAAEVPELPVAEGPRPFRVALLSDPHTEAEGSPLYGAISGKLADAVADYRSLKPDLWLVNGDVANNGLQSEMEALKKIMLKGAKPDQLLVTTGNHDFYDKDATDEEELRRFRATFGLEQAYTSRVAGGVNVVMLADEQYKSAKGPRDWAWLKPEQLRWFEQVLQAHRDKLTVVCLHQPLQDTVIWSHGGNDFAGCGQAKELRAIIAKHPQIKLWFSGHTHMGAEVAGNVSRQGHVTFMGVGSTYYQFVKSDAPEAAEYGGFIKSVKVNQSRMLEVWPEKVVVRTRDHIAKAWLTELDHELKRG